MNSHRPDNVNESGDDGLAAGIAYEQLLRCVHCGLCTSSCPTFLETGDENNGPRGRIQLIRMVADGRTDLTGRMERHLQLCLDCRACEAACPSGVKYGRLIEPFRQAIEARDTRVETRWDLFRRVILLNVFPYADRLRHVLRPMRLLQRLGVVSTAERLGLMKLLPGRLGRLAPLLPPPVRPGARLPKFLPAVGRKRARVAFFVGCVADAMFRPVHWATVRVLQENGCDVFVPRGQACCGAIHLHNGDSLGAAAGRREPRGLRAGPLRCDPGEPRRLRGDAQGVRPSLARRFATAPRPFRRQGEGRSRVPRPARRRALQRPHRGRGHLPRLVPPRTCPGSRLGAAATVGEDSRPGTPRAARGRRLLRGGRRLQPDRGGDVGSACAPQAGQYPPHRAQIVLAANAGCLLQIQREVRQAGLGIRVMHPMELMDMSYRGEKLELKVDARNRTMTL